MADDLDDIISEFDGDKEEKKPAAKASAPPRKKSAPKQTRPETKRILLEENDDIPPTGLYIAHNGRGYMIQAGIEVDVPTHLLEILDNAIMSQPRIDPNTSRIVGYRTKMRYPYRVITD